MNKWIAKPQSEWARNKMNLLGSERVPFAFLIDFLSEQPVVLPLSQCQNNGLYFIFPNASIVPPIQAALPDAPVFHPKPSKFADYKKGYKTVMQNLTHGNSYLTNYTISTRVITNYSPETLFGRLNSKYQVLYQSNFICFSPETFITIYDNTIRSFPMKGTIDASVPNAEHSLRNNPKEIAEHNTITDLIRNDLNQVAQKVTVSRAKFIDTIEAQGRKLLQMSSEVSGSLPKGWQGQIGDILYKLLPAGSICGAPKEKTVEIILDSESHSRGYYTGVFGVFDGQTVDSCVLIRFLEQTHKGIFFYKSGGGITIRSEIDSEFEEANKKVYVPVV